MLSLKKFRMFPERGTVVLAVSGGIDSTVMAYILCPLVKECGLQPVICHLNHLLRGVESDRDEAFVVSLASEFGVECETQKVDIPEIISGVGGGSIQSVARRERFGFFQRISRKYSSDHIFLAHNLDDLCETFLMRLFRGSGGYGLGSMAPVSIMKGLTLMRPLLDIPREDISKFVEENKIRYVEDSSNTSVRYDRNRIRHHILPLIERELNPGLRKTLKMVTDLMKEDEDYFARLVESHFVEMASGISPTGITLRLVPFKKLHPALQSRIVRRCLRELKGDLQGISYVNVADVLHISKSEARKKKILLPDGIVVEKLNASLMFSVTPTGKHEVVRLPVQ